MGMKRVGSGRVRALATDVLIVGGGLGGVAAALSVARLGKRAVMTEPTGWLGGQVSAQAVPFDEHPWIEMTGCTRKYRELRTRVRDYYRLNYPLLPSARSDPEFNPGMGFSTRLCVEPRVADAVISDMLSPHRSSGRVRVLLHHVPSTVNVNGDRVVSVEFRDLVSGSVVEVEAAYVVDASELGDVLDLADVEHVIGAESKAETGELHALDEADPLDQQATTWAFAMDYFPGEDHTIERPADYDFWRAYQADFWPGPQLGWTVSDAITGRPLYQPLFEGPPEARLLNDLWHYRRLLYARHYPQGEFGSDITLVKWPQNDYWLKPLVGVTDAERDASLRGAQQLSLSLLYWMQTEAPHHEDDGHGYPGLRLRDDVVETADGLAKHVYVRESRRIRAEFTVAEQHIGVEARPGAHGAEQFRDSVGLGAARIDLHPSTGNRNYVDVDSWPFQIPLASLIPVRVANVIAGAKNIGSTHITNGSYRWHHVEWNIGEAAGALAAFCLSERCPPTAVRNVDERLTAFQQVLTEHLGIQIAWPEIGRLGPAQRFGSPSAIHGGSWFEVDEQGRYSPHSPK